MQTSLLSSQVAYTIPQNPVSHYRHKVANRAPSTDYLFPKHNRLDNSFLSYVQHTLTKTQQLLLVLLEYQNANKKLACENGSVQ